MFRLLLSLAMTMALHSSACAGVPELRLKDRLDGSRQPVRVAAHRGASASAPENTAASFAGAVDAKADLIEFDVRVTTDNKLLVFHDNDLQRYGGGKTLFAELSSEQALQLDVGSFFDASYASERTPTMTAAVQQCLDGGSIPLIEHKTGSAVAYLAELRALKVIDKVVVQSFKWDFLTELRKLEPKLQLGALGSGEITAETLAKLAKFSPEMVAWKDSDITTAAIENFHTVGYAVAVWTVNDERRMKTLAQSGVDIIITDKPAEAKAALNQP